MVPFFRCARAVALLMLFFSPQLQADRYFTWVDDQGQLRTTLIKESNPLIDADPRVDKSAVPPESGVQAEPAPGSGAGTTAVQAEPSAPAAVNQNHEQEDIGSTPRSDRAPLQQNPGDATQYPDAPPLPHRDYQKFADNPVYNLINFPDAAQLAAAGYIREGDPGPFYTWTDATGTIHNSPFNPGKEWNLLRKKKAEARAGIMLGSVFSDARISRRRGGLPEGAGQLAGIVLGLGGDAPRLMEQFGESCCEGLRKERIHELEADRTTSLRIDESAPVHNFPTGRSAYRIVALPPGDGLFSLRLRSFINDGVFLPTLVFLDESWEPVRLVTDIEFSYEPESWYRYGYLQARLPVESRSSERWLLVLSKGEDLRADSTILSTGKAQRPVALNPVGQGEMELSLSAAGDPY